MGNCKAHKTLFTLQENDLEFLSNGLGERLVKVVRREKLGIYEDKVLNGQEMEPLIQRLYTLHIYRNYRPGSSVGITTDYGLDGLGSKAGGDEIFYPSRPALGPNHPPVPWVPGLSRG